MRDLLILLVHLITTTARLMGPGGARSVVAESLLVKHQLLILNRSRQRAPNLRASDRLLAGVCSLFIRPTRVVRSAIVLKPSTILDFHRHLRTRKYRLLCSPREVGQHVAHEPVDDGVPRSWSCAKLLLALNIRPRNKLIAAVLHQRPRTLRRGFQVELQADHVVFQLKRLIRAAGTLSQPRGVFRQVEGFAMPVKDEALGWKAEGQRGCRHAANRKPPDLLQGTTEDACAQGTGNELGAQTHPQHGNISSDDIPDKLFLGGEPGQGRLVVDAHGTPQGNQHIDTVERW